MFNKNPVLGAVLMVMLCAVCGVMGWMLHTPPEDVIEMTVHGLYVNGKHVDLDKLKMRLPLVPAPNKDGRDGKKRLGDLPKVPAAMLLPGVPPGGCVCGEACACNPCHCHAATAINLHQPGSSGPVQDDGTQPVVGQRNGNSKSPELFGIDSLVAILKDFKEAIFGSNGKPGLRDDIAGGLRDFYSTVRTGVIVAGGCIVIWMIWVGVNIQRIADRV